MSYLDKIKNNKQKVFNRTKKLNQVKKKEERNKVPVINLIKPDEKQEIKLEVINVNGSKPNEISSSKNESGFSIKISGPKDVKKIDEKSEKSFKSISAKKQSGVFKKKTEPLKFDSDKELSAGSSELKDSALLQSKEVKKSKFGHTRKESKSQREHLKLAIDKKILTKSQRGMETPSKNSRDYLIVRCDD